jgi:hypothetical protein
MATLSRGVKNGNRAKERGRGDDFEQSLLLLFLFFSPILFFASAQTFHHGKEEWKQWLHCEKREREGVREREREREERKREIEIEREK